VVEGYRADEVVADVRAYDVMEEVCVNEAKVAVDGCGGSTGEGSGVVTVVWERTICMVKKGDRHNPMVYPEIGDQVENNNIPNPK